MQEVEKPKRRKKRQSGVKGCERMSEGSSEQGVIKRAERDIQLHQEERLNCKAIYQGGIVKKKTWGRGTKRNKRFEGRRKDGRGRRSGAD